MCNKNKYTLKMKTTTMYVSPELVKIEVKVEAGFEASGSGGISGGNDGGEV